MKLNQQMLALGCMASMIPLMTGCEKEEEMLSAKEAVLYRVPIDSQGRFDEKQAEKNIKQIDFDKNIKLFQNLIDETSEAGRMTDDVWNRFVAVYAKNNVGSEQWIQEAKPFVRAVIENPNACNMIQDNRTDEAKAIKTSALSLLVCVLMVASSCAAVKFACKDKDFGDIAKFYGVWPMVLGGVWIGSSLGANQEKETVQQAAMNIQKAAYQQTLQQVKQIVAQQDNTAQPAPIKIQGAKNQQVKQTIPQHLQENQRS